MQRHFTPGHCHATRSRILVRAPQAVATSHMINTLTREGYYAEKIK